MRHAFHVEPPGPVAPSPEERETVERILGVIVRKGMVGPTVLFLDSVRPMNYISAQAIHYFAPFASVLVDRAAMGHMASYLERRGSIDWLCARLEELEAGESQR
jgi:hypothetical protein